MTSSPDLIHELRASRPSASADLRARVRELAIEQPARRRRPSWRFSIRRGALIAVPAAVAIARTRSLGGYVVSSAVTAGEQGSASLTVRVPVARVQDAIAGLSGLGRIVSQQVSVEDLQEQLDQLEHRRASLVEQITRITA